MVQTVCRTIVISQLLFKVIDAPVMQVLQVSQVTPTVLGQVVVLVWWRFHRSSSWTRLWCLQVLWFRQCLPTGGPQLQFIMVVVIPVITQRQIPMVLVTKRFPCCLIS